MPKDVNLQVVPASGAGAALLAEIQRFCEAAYGEDLSALFAAYVPDVHVLALSGGRLVGYAMIVSRWLQAGNGPMLRTAYIEMVATSRRPPQPGHRRAGNASHRSGRQPGGLPPGRPLPRRHHPLQPPGLGVLARATIHTARGSRGWKRTGIDSNAGGEGNGAAVGCHAAPGLDVAALCGVAGWRGVVVGGEAGEG